jgi:tetratricopeptide (TPR) repeat protein
LLDRLGSGGMGEVWRACDPALGRDLAVKVMKSRFRGHRPSEQRFIREARVAGSLQHPGIAPVHNLGRMTDGCLFFTMKLVRGRTFAEILDASAGKPEGLPTLLVVFEKTCQAVAYAHSKQVIHRDLKPANVMVGKFGEVQVMDWGLAKLLAGEDTSGDEADDGSATVIRTESADGPGAETLIGDVIGTPAYMPPEQACGSVDQVDERSDVFALGAILLEILTGKPPYAGLGGEGLLSQARCGDLTQSILRLEACGAHAALTRLCRDCLSAAQADRPRDAGVVAERVAAYQAEAQERLRQAELERAEAEVRAQGEHARATVEKGRAQEALARAGAERRARQRLLALAAAVLVIVVGAGGGAWWWQQRRAEAAVHQREVDDDVNDILNLARQQLEDGWKKQDLVTLEDAKKDAEKAVAIAHSDASPPIKEQAKALQQKAEDLLGRAQVNRELLEALVDVSWTNESRVFAGGHQPGALTVSQTTTEEQAQFVDEGGSAIALSQPSVDEQFAAAFRRWDKDLDVDGGDESQVAERLQKEPPVVVEQIVAALDAWMLKRREAYRPGTDWRRLFRLADRLDRPLDENGQRRQLRECALGETMPRTERVTKLQELRNRVDSTNAPVLNLVLMARAYAFAGDVPAAEQVLHHAVAARPQEVALLTALGDVLDKHGSSRASEAIEVYRAARALRPRLGILLVRALIRANREPEAEDVIRFSLSQRRKDSAIYYLLLGDSLSHRKSFDEAVESYDKALELQPKFAWAFTNRGSARLAKKEYDKAIADFDEAIRLAPNYASAFGNRGSARLAKNEYDKAIADFDEAIRLDPKLTLAFGNRGSAWWYKKEYDKAIADCDEAIRLAPNYAWAFTNRGIARLAKKEYDKAIADFDEAIRLDPKLALAFGNRGNAWLEKKEYDKAIADFDKAIADFDEAIRLDHKFAPAFNNRGSARLEKKEYDKAIADFDEAIRLDPKYAPAFGNRGSARLAKNEYDKAIADFDEAIRLDPKYASAFGNRGNAWLAKKEYDKAIADYDEAIRLDPHYALAFSNRGIAWLAKKEYDKAIAVFDEAIRLNHKFAWAFTNRGNARWNKKEYDKAIADYDEAIRLDPQLALAFNSRARLRATCLDEKHRSAKQAIQDALRACERSDWAVSSYLDTLAAAYAEAGDFEEAVKWQQKAVESSKVDKSFIERSSLRLKLYQAHKPLRER